MKKNEKKKRSIHEYATCPLGMNSYKPFCECGMNHPKQKIKVFLGLSEISGLYYGLEAGFKQLGIGVTRLDFANHPFKYSQQDKFLVKVFQHCQLNLESSKKVARLLYKGLSVISKLLIFISVLFRHNVFIFSYGTSFFRYLDLPILKFFNKKVIFQFHGSDSRPPYVDGTLIGRHSTSDIAKMTRVKKKQMKIINHYADAIIDIPTMGLFHEKKFINWLQIGLTVSITKKPDLISSNSHTKKSVTILHAPSNPLAKGTAIIEATIKYLAKHGYEIKLIKIDNEPHQKVKEALLACDFVIDQLFADYPMPGFATESAWYGKPTIICGYAKNLWNELLVKDAMPPTLYCHPDELEQSIKKLYEDTPYRLQLGQMAFEFVSRRWSPIEVAKRYLDVIDNKIPLEWYYDPVKINYTHGCCISEVVLKEFLKKYITEEGDTSLMLEDKPSLKKSFLEFAELTDDVKIGGKQ